MTMKYCTNCGSPLDDNAAVCDKCGKPLNNVDAPQQAAPTTPAEKVSAFGIIAFILSIIGFMTGFLRIGVAFDVVAIILAIIVLIKSKRKPTKKGLPIAGISVAAVSLIFMAIIYGGISINNWNKVKNVEEQIDNIGQVTINSKDFITAAEEGYNKLSDEQKEKVDNYDVLTTARANYNEIQRADMLEKARLTNVATLPDEVDNNFNVVQQEYNGKIVAFGSYVIDINDNNIDCTFTWGANVNYIFASQGIYGYKEAADAHAYFVDSNVLYNLNKGDNILIMGRLEVLGQYNYVINDAYLLTQDEYDLIQNKTNAEIASGSE
ncbi:MAG TPA: zinc ribbon domain-containing protein [Candidatus Ornithomonoglobus merdipullorum]|uniref:Zinc ribbon domain-containing protein n=1 Tax=Candidatus Ornithomonoglobus merdipullorum TaxID=2840895 RepID=A0A9D1MCI1_9FIRM|nr:zinc ribbon domain-containing protein [Candidatus Ornithomonoglobus merdipullorum]